MFASGHEEAARNLVFNIERVILFPLISVLLGAALLYFLWGMFQFAANADDESARTTGKRHMIYGVIGMVIMLSALSILFIAANSFGVADALPSP